MIRKLTIDEVISLVKSAPEQSVFDWKSDFTLPNNPDAQGEFIKDLAAIANGCESSYGFIVYGVDPRKPDPISGITKSYDDAKLQQLIKDKIKPAPDFVYYEVSFGPKIVGVVQVSPTRLRPHIISVDLGKVRNGQIPIRRGSCTDGVTLKDLWEFFYGQSSGHFPGVAQQLQAHAQETHANVAYMRELREQANQSLRDMESISGVPRGTLGGK